MATEFHTEIGPVTEDQATLIRVDLDTTQIVSRSVFKNGRAYLAFWAEGHDEAEAAISRATHNVPADFMIWTGA